MGNPIDKRLTKSSLVFVFPSRFICKCTESTRCRRRLRLRRDALSWLPIAFTFTSSFPEGTEKLTEHEDKEDLDQTIYDRPSWIRKHNLNFPTKSGPCFFGPMYRTKGYRPKRLAASWAIQNYQVGIDTTWVIRWGDRKPKFGCSANLEWFSSVLPIQCA